MQRILAALRARPLLFNCTTSSILWGVGDFAAQQIQGGDYDVKRTMVNSSWGGGVFAPIFFYWWKALDARYPTSAGLVNAAKKVAINQLLVAVPINAGYFAYAIFSSRVIDGISGSSLFNSCSSVSKEEDVSDKPSRAWRGMQAEIHEKISSDIVFVTLRSFYFWPLANGLNVVFVPPQARVHFISVCSAIWTCFLSFTHNRTRQDQQSRE